MIFLNRAELSPHISFHFISYHFFQERRKKEENKNKGLIGEDDNDNNKTTNKCVFGHEQSRLAIEVRARVAKAGFSDFRMAVQVVPMVSSSNMKWPLNINEK